MYKKWQKKAGNSKIRAQSKKSCNSSHFFALTKISSRIKGSMNLFTFAQYSFQDYFFLIIDFFDTGDYFTLCKMLQLNDDKTPSTDYDTLLHTILFVRMAKRANLEDPLSMMFEKIKGTKEIP